MRAKSDSTVCQPCFGLFKNLWLLLFQIILCIAYTVSFCCLACNLEKLTPWIFPPVFMVFITAFAIICTPLIQKRRGFRKRKLQQALFAFAIVFAAFSAISFCYILYQFIFNAVEHCSAFFFTAPYSIYPMLFAECCGIFSLGFFVFSKISCSFNSVDFSAIQSESHTLARNNVLIVGAGIFTALLVSILCLSALFMQTNTVYDEMLLCQKRYIALPIDVPNAFSVSSRTQIRAAVFPSQDYEVTYQAKDLAPMLHNTKIDAAASYLTIKDDELKLNILLACKGSFSSTFIAEISYFYKLNYTELTYAGAIFYSNDKALAGGNDSGLWISKLGTEYMGYYYETIKPDVFSEMSLQEISTGIVRDVVISDFMANQLYLFKQPDCDMSER